MCDAGTDPMHNRLFMSVYAKFAVMSSCYVGPRKLKV